MSLSNLVMVDAHDLGRHLACYGYSAIPSDALDDLARRGVRFTNAHCTAPQCSPSRASLYTGRHAHDVGVLGLAHPPFDWRLQPAGAYLAHQLKQAGWATHHIGVQHVVRDEPRYVHELGFDTHEASHAPADVVASAAIARIDGARAPYFLNIGFEEPHRDAQGRYKTHPPFDARGVSLPPYLPDTLTAREEMAELQGAIHAMDRAMARILAAIEARDDAHDTWIIFTTDHGLALPRAKASMYDPGLAVALLMYWPARGLTGGRDIAALTSHVDLVPTILEGLDVPRPDTLHGRSLWPVLHGSSERHRTHVFAEKTFHTAYEPQRAVRSDRHKLIANFEVDILNVPGDVLRSPITATMVDEIALERPPLELYDLETDPEERINRIEDPDYASIAHELRDALVTWMQETNDPLLDGAIASPYRQATLRALGLPARPSPYP